MSKWKEKKKWIKIQNLHVVETLEWSSGFRTIKFLQYGDSILQKPDINEFFLFYDMIL